MGVKQKDIQEADVQKESLTADKEQHESEVKRLSKEITDHEASTAQYKKDEEEATKDRKAQREIYEKTHADYSESVSAITEAIAVLKERAANTPQAASLLQQLEATLLRLPAE